MSASMIITQPGDILIIFVCIAAPVDSSCSVTVTNKVVYITQGMICIGIYIKQMEIHSRGHILRVAGETTC